MKQRLKRNQLVYLISRSSTDLYIQTWHNIEVNKAENLPKTGPGLIIPKHQSMKDIPLEGYILNKYVKRPASWIMKYSLPKCLEKIGAVRVYRQKDIKKQLKKIKGKQEGQKQLKNNFKEKIKQTNEKAMEYMKWLYQNNELIVLHAEGMRNYRAINPINMSLIKYTNQLQEELGIKIPLILMGIEYKNIKKPRSKVIVNIRQLSWDTQNLEQTISNKLAELSNIKSFNHDSSS